MSTFFVWLEQVIIFSPENQQKLIQSLIWVVIIWLFYRFILRIFIKRIDDARTRYKWQKNSTYSFYFLLLLILGRIWLREGIDTYSTYFGLLSAGLAIAMKEPIANIFGWVLIIWRRPFSVGERIQIGEFAGDVVDINVVEFTILEIGNWVESDQSTGRVINIPNGKIFSEPLANFSRGIEHLWHEIPVLITFESDWKKAKNLLQEIIAKHATIPDGKLTAYSDSKDKGYMIHYAQTAPIIYTSVRDSGILLTLRYLCGIRMRRGSENKIWEDILEIFSMHKDIDFAYPTQRFYKQNEGNIVFTKENS
ncbi:MAG: mechanosensitive ion channel [Chloroflexi bacterium]|nr:mechanosensitive ion channel [Chloroflexota bacterium]